MFDKHNDPLTSPCGEARGSSFSLFGSDSLHRHRLQGRIDDLSPIQIAPLQAVDQDLRGGGVGGKGDVVLVAHLVDVLQVRVQVVGLGVREEEDHINLVVSDAGTDLLAAAVGVGQEQPHRQARGLRHQTARGVGGADGVLGQHAAVGDAELHHQLFFVVVTHDRDIHIGHPFTLASRSGNDAG